MFNAANYMWNPAALPNAFTALVVLILGLVVLRREGFSHTGRTFSLFCLCVFAWQLFTSACYLSRTPEVAFAWSQVSWIVIPFLVPAIFHFTVVILANYSQQRHLVWGSWIISAVLSLFSLGTSWAVDGVYHYWWAFYPKYGWLGFVVVGYFTVMIGLTFWNYWKAHTQSVRGGRSESLVRGMALGFGIASLASFDFLPSFGFEIYPIGFAPILLFSIVSVYTIWNFHLNPITPAFAAKKIVSTMADPLIVCNAQGEIQVTNPSFQSTFGFEQGEVIGETIMEVFDPSLKDEGTFTSFLEEEQVTNQEMTLFSKNDDRVVVSLSTAKLKNSKGIDAGNVILFHDITQQRKLEEELRFKTLHDQLTGLPNRPLFRDRLQVAFERARRRPDFSFGVFFLDLDRFKLINDSLGHPAGDQLLQAVALRFKDVLRSSDTVARFGGDEFGFLLTDVEDESDIKVIAEKLLNELQKPFEIRGQKIFTNASIGIVFPTISDYSDTDSIIRDADTAMYRAKSEGGGQYVIFDPSMHMQAKERLGLERDLQVAVSKDELQLWYQPIVSLDNGNTTGLEALVRWQHPERDLIMPGDFLPLAEKTGHMVDIDRWVLEHACRTMVRWKQEFPWAQDLFISVNCSPQFLASPDFFTICKDALEQSGLKPSSLYLEIVESTVMENPNQMARVLSRLQELGVKVVMDDFGTGYSSLSYLHSLPINTLKIDRNFINDMRPQEQDGNKLRITRSIVNLGKSLQKDIIAEGVETTEQVNLLKMLQCQMGQGYHFARPKPGEDVPEFFGTLSSMM